MATLQRAELLGLLQSTAHLRVEFLPGLVVLLVGPRADDDQMLLQAREFAQANPAGRD